MLRVKCGRQLVDEFMMLPDPGPWPAATGMVRKSVSAALFRGAELVERLELLQQLLALLGLRVHLVEAGRQLDVFGPQRLLQRLALFAELFELFVVLGF